MPNRADMDCVPEGSWARARWAERNLSLLLQNAPLQEGWSGLAALEARLFPPRRNPTSKLDPTCPTCGVETDTGRVDSDGESYSVHYDTCGHVVLMSQSELEGRMRAGHA